MLDRATLREFNGIYSDLRLLLPKLPKWRVEQFQTLVATTYRTKWAHRKYRKYGSISKAFTDEELRLFLDAIDEPRFKLLFSYQAFLAMRVGEVCKINIKDFDLRLGELRILTEKSHFLDTLKVPNFLLGNARLPKR